MKKLSLMFLIAVLLLLTLVISCGEPGFDAYLLPVEEYPYILTVNGWDSHEYAYEVIAKSYTFSGNVLVITDGYYSLLDVALPWVRAWKSFEQQTFHTSKFAISVQNR